MSRPRLLDKGLLQKVCKKLGKKDIRKINVMVSQKASNLGISPEAALILIAKGLGIGTASYQRKLDPYKKTEVRELLPSLLVGRRIQPSPSKSASKQEVKIGLTKRDRLKLIIEYLIQDEELKKRCQDILLAASRFDRPINQATLVLEDRIRVKTQPPQRLEGIKLVNYALKEDLNKTILKISDNPDEQAGVVSILRGVMLAFRNPTHHYVTDSFTREQALKVCGFIDVLLRIIDNSQKIR